ncbi:hypothetical protein D917_05844 [Trichinella nativa]|uniref:Uncharacterized protein n=1 Tax=Trichinella nativa TaxID=6335 RepID=A0A1Y3EUY9_9BILA|nr:hypothetical protein D917_05844 [Trichinella nativa]
MFVMKITNEVMNTQIVTWSFSAVDHLPQQVTVSVVSQLDDRLRLNWHLSAWIASIDTIFAQLRTAELLVTLQLIESGGRIQPESIQFNCIAAEIANQKKTLLCAKQASYPLDRCLLIEHPPPTSPGLQRTARTLRMHLLLSRPETAEIEFNIGLHLTFNFIPSSLGITTTNSKSITCNFACKVALLLSN